MSKFSEALQDYFCSAKSMSRAELSRRTGISYPSICSYIKGKSEPSLANALKIEKALQGAVRLSDFSGLPHPPPWPCAKMGININARLIDEFVVQENPFSISKRDMEEMLEVLRVHHTQTNTTDDFLEGGTHENRSI